MRGKCVGFPYPVSRIPDSGGLGNSEEVVLKRIRPGATRGLRVRGPAFIQARERPFPRRPLRAFAARAGASRPLR